ncbi:hypothetical protein [Runella sp.]|uniref:hypothetical protein n=1 Tax=Runella sp. TaxID=1960881 RepID=UPI003D1223DA
MKSLIATAALSLLVLSTVAEAQPQKDQSLIASNLMASLPTQDVESVITTKSSVNYLSLLASLPIVDENVETPAYVNASALMASLPIMDENVEVPASLYASKLMASLPTMDENVEMPAKRINIAKLMASLPIMDEMTVTSVLSVLVDTNINHLDTKNQTAIRLTEE